MNYFVGDYTEMVNDAIGRLKEEQVAERIWNKDYTLWSIQPDEISNRLGWLNSPEVTTHSLGEIKKFVDEIRTEGYTHALLMGMGGSSLAPEVLRFTYGVRDTYLDLSVLDTTDPDTILGIEKKLNPAETLYIVSTKSGGTVETISYMKFFYNSVLEKLGSEKVGRHFIAITDPGSGLEEMARNLKFRKIFLNDPDIGGRYSALSLFGIVPAAIIGADVVKLISVAQKEAALCKSNKSEIMSNHAAILGVIIGVLAQNGKEKLTFFTSTEISGFGAWVEQLVAESTGKAGKGILPVDLEEVQSTGYYADDRVFVNLKLAGDSSNEKIIESLKNSGHPVIEILLNDLYDLSREFFRWEFATAVAGWYLNIQPFDQPNVEEAKIIARKMVKEFQENGKLPEVKPALVSGSVKVYGDITAAEVKGVLKNFLSAAKSGKNYVSIQAYLTPGDRINSALQKLRTKIHKQYKVATTVGYGPRFLHSTGQLHKGDSGNGLFIQLIAQNKNDAVIPDKAGESESSISFGVLIHAQALGDRQALLDNKRKVVTIEMSGELDKTIDGLL